MDSGALPHRPDLLGMPSQVPGGRAMDTDAIDEAGGMVNENTRNTGKKEKAYPAKTQRSKERKGFVTRLFHGVF